jgi:hypothetical protein
MQAGKKASKQAETTDPFMQGWGTSVSFGDSRATAAAAVALGAESAVGIEALPTEAWWAPSMAHDMIVTGFYALRRIGWPSRMVVFVGLAPDGLVTMVALQSSGCPPWEVWNCHGFGLSPSSDHQLFEL